nr:MAG TPA: hypothetical protein [Caudoviricetes sp.]DAG45585.1 MAG TPA: hypothetical protein [Caudoviricetes sp.]DAL97161.1 MAG TPA: hypothetical protein [Caudoviricetes sp.]DAM13689.1 MAG TPA: hypothetical protein [Caudoviricetes sp.]DAQ88281.1 MAG TPA: hypothetical protein [Caudoviricetes sp.]
MILNKKQIKKVSRKTHLFCCYPSITTSKRR